MSAVRVILGIVLVAIGWRTFFSVSGQSQVTGAGGTVSGVVKSTDGVPLAGSVVHFRRVPRLVMAQRGRSPRLGAGESFFGARASAGPDGTYRITGLPSGLYYYCATPADIRFLDTCLWFPVSSVTITAGGSATVPEIRAARAGTVSFVISDPQRLGRSATDPGRGLPNLTFGVRTAGGAFSPAYPRPRPSGCQGRVVAPEVCLDEPSINSAQTVYEVRVPLDTTFLPWVHGPSFSLRDDKGMEVDVSGLSSQFTLTSSAATRTFQWMIARR